MQMVNLGDIYASEAGKLNPQVDYPRLSLLAHFLYWQYRMGRTYGSKASVQCCLSRSGAERLVECYGETVPGVVADNSLPRMGVDVYLGTARPVRLGRY